MNPISNAHDIALPLAVWAVNDEYDYINEPGYISATSLMKPIRQIIIPPRLPPEARQEDVDDYVSRALGHSVHDSLEKAWVNNYAWNLKKLGYPQAVIDRILINPSDEQLEAANDPVPVHLERRTFRRLGDYIIGGKFDMVTDGIVNDLKSTSAYKWMLGSNDDYQLQGSIYRWIDAKGFNDVQCTEAFKPRITEDYIRINFIFTDWQKSQANGSKGYPPRRIMHKDIPLLSLEETESWIREQIRLIERFKDKPEAELPECTDEELWRSDPVFKYFANPAKTAGRSTRNFSTMEEAVMFKAEKGGKGVVIHVPGEPKRCAYCPAFEGCTQKDKYQ